MKKEERKRWMIVGKGTEGKNEQRERDRARGTGGVAKMAPSHCSQKKDVP